MNLEARTIEKIVGEFSEPDQSVVIELLKAYKGPEPARVVWDVLLLSKGSLDGVTRYLKAAQTDYRDVLYWAEYYATDPMLKDKDPMSLANEIITKIGREK